MGKLFAFCASLRVIQYDHRVLNAQSSYNRCMQMKKKNEQKNCMNAARPSLTMWKKTGASKCSGSNWRLNAAISANPNFKSFFFLLCRVFVCENKMSTNIAASGVPSVQLGTHLPMGQISLKPFNNIFFFVILLKAHSFISA